MFRYPDEGTPVGRVTARRRRPTPRCQLSTDGLRPRCETWEPASRRGVSVLARYTPARARGSRQLATWTASSWLDEASGGAGSGGKPDKAGANFDLR